MPKASLDELRGRVSAGEYDVDAGALAGDMLSKFELIRRVRRMLMSGDEPGDPGVVARVRERRRDRAGGARGKNASGKSSPR
jgi:hypothetical protein